MSTTDTPVVVTDADLINKYAAMATEEPEQVVETQAPLGPEVNLPGGFILEGAVVNTAEVRELNGVDEEAIANAPTTGKALNILLQRGLVKIGGKDVTRDDLDALLAGDRDAILIAIRRVTFGGTAEYRVTCAACDTDQNTVVDLDKDVPVKKLENSEERTWNVETKKGFVTVGLPTGITQKKLLENSEKTSAELNTILLSGCVLSVNGIPSMGASTVLKLGMADRANLVKEIIERNPGPRLGEVKKACEACGEEMNLPISLVDLFRI